MSTTEAQGLGTAILSDGLDDDPPFTVHGVALGSGDVTVGQSGLKKVWPAEALQEAAETLAGKPIVKNHENRDIDAIVGKVTNAKFRDSVGVVYEGQVNERKYAEMISRGELDVSPAIIHPHPEELEENDDGALVVEHIEEFVNLALVQRGAAPSNEVESGAGDLAAAELQAMFDYDDELADGTVQETAETDPDEVTEELKSVAGVSFEGTKGGKLDESAIPDDEFESHYLFDGETKSESSYPVVDGDGNLRKGNVEAAFKLGARGGVSEDELTRKLKKLNDEFENRPIDPEKLSVDREPVTDDELQGHRIEQPIEILQDNIGDSVDDDAVSDLDILNL